MEHACNVGTVLSDRDKRIPELGWNKRAETANKNLAAQKDEPSSPVVRMTGACEQGQGMHASSTWLHDGNIAEPTAGEGQKALR